MQEWHIVMDDGYELIITCEEATITKNGLGEITNIHWKGIKDNVPIKMDLEKCKCIYYKELKESE